MAKRPLPSTQEALRILAEKRTRPQRRAPPPLGRALGKTLKAFLGADAVQKLRIVQGPLQAAKPAARPRRRLPPLDAAAEAKLAADLAGAPEGRLKSALMALGRGVLRQR